MIISLTSKELLEFPKILPIQGSLKTLESVQGILEKIKINNESELSTIKNVDFSKEEINFILEMIEILDKNQQLHFGSLTLVQKILKIKETENVKL